MFFNSFAFAIFLPIVFILYWFVFNKNKSTQNALLIIASYYFYSCWDWRFLFLLVFSTFLDYYTGIQIEKAKKESIRKFWFWLSISVNLGFLGVLNIIISLLIPFRIYSTDSACERALCYCMSFFQLGFLFTLFMVYRM